MSYQEQARRYYELLAQGYSAQAAFNEAFPNGIPTAEERKKQESKDKRDQSLGQTLGLVAGAAGTRYVAKQAGEYFKGDKADPNATKTDTKTQAETPPPSTSENVTTEPNSTSSDTGTTDIAGAPGYGGEPVLLEPGQATPSGYTEVATHESGGTVAVPNENINKETGSVNLGRWAQGAAGALQLYQGYQRFDDGDAVGGTLSTAQGAANLAAAAGSSTATSAAPYLSYAQAAYNMHNTAQDGSMTREQKGTRMAQQAGLAYLDAMTFGLASLGEGWLRSTGTGGKYMRKLDRMSAKYSPVAKIIGAGLGGLDTKHTQIKNTRDLFGDAEKLQEENPDYYNYLMGARHETIDKEKPEVNKQGLYYHGGDYRNWEEYKAAGLDATDLTHVLGNLQTFGPEKWASLTESQRQAVTQAMIDNDMYISDKGEVNIRKSNRDRAREIFNEMEAAGFPPPPTLLETIQEPGAALTEAASGGTDKNLSTNEGAQMAQGSNWAAQENLNQILARQKWAEGAMDPRTAMTTPDPNQVDPGVYATEADMAANAQKYGDLTKPSVGEMQSIYQSRQMQPTPINSYAGQTINGFYPSAAQNPSQIDPGFNNPSAVWMPSSAPQPQFFSPQAAQQYFQSDAARAQYQDPGELNKAYWAAHDEAVKRQRQMQDAAAQGQALTAALSK